MSDKKLTSDEVPQKFSEWLLAMGCPPEIVPSVDKVADMCRGQTYSMVWRRLMERVEPKDTVKTKRLQVFCDDMNKCEKVNALYESTNIVVPEELSLWKEQSQLQDKVRDAEQRVLNEKNKLQQLMDKNSTKLSHRTLFQKRVQDAERRSYLLQKVEAELSDKKANLTETKAIAESLCGIDEGDDAANKLDKCMKTMCNQSSVAKSINKNEEELISSLVKCRGDILMDCLHSRRAKLCDDLTAPVTAVNIKDSVTYRSVLAHTAALQCNLTLDAVKNRINVNATREKFLVAVTELSKHLSEDSCEVLVSQAEVSERAARVRALRVASSTVKEHASRDLRNLRITHCIPTLDASIESKRDELKRLILATAAIERKTISVRDCLTALFNGFHEDRNTQQIEGRSSLPQDTVASLRQFYSESKIKRKLQLSMDLDASDSFTDADLSDPRFTDELNLYLKKFNLEKNRKIVLDSGEKLWIFETVSSSLERIRSKWQADDVTTSLLCPSVSLARNINIFTLAVARKAELETLAKKLEGGKKEWKCINITNYIDNEQKTLDKIKRRLKESILSLEKTNNTLNAGREDMQFWSNNNIKKYISKNRKVDGKSYSEYEYIYLDVIS